MLSAKRYHKAVPGFSRKALGQHAMPARITIDKSGINTAVI